MKTAQPQLLLNKPNGSQKAASTDPHDSEQVARIWYSINNLPGTCFFKGPFQTSLAMFVAFYTTET